MFNYTKLKISALIALGGFITVVLPAITLNLTAVIENGAAFDWKTPLIMGITAISTWVVATAKNYITKK